MRIDGGRTHIELAVVTQTHALVFGHVGVGQGDTLAVGDHIRVIAHLGKRDERKQRSDGGNECLAHAPERLRTLVANTYRPGLSAFLALRIADFRDSHQHVTFSVPDEAIDMVHEAIR